MTDVDLEALRTSFADYELGPPLGWPALTALETSWGVVLPEPYRSFVATIGTAARTVRPAAGWCRWDRASTS